MKRTEKFTRVFLERKDLVMKYIYRRIGKIEEAEELTQEVFMAYYENMDFSVDSETGEIKLLYDVEVKPGFIYKAIKNI